MAGPGVAVLLDAVHGRVGGQPRRRLEPLICVAIQAWRQREVAVLVEFIAGYVALAVGGPLKADELWSTSVVTVQREGDAARGMAMAANVKHTRVRHDEVVRDRVHAVAVVALGAVARARRPRRQVQLARSGDGDVRVPWNRGITHTAEGGRDVILARIRLRRVVVPRQVVVRLLRVHDPALPQVNDAIGWVRHALAPEVSRDGCAR